MPSLNHEGVIALVRDRPAFAASLLRELMHIEVPHFTEARFTEAALPQLVPVGYHADAVVLFANNKNKPVFGTIFEVQLESKARKSSPGRSTPLPPARATSVRSSYLS